MQIYLCLEAQPESRLEREKILGPGEIIDEITLSSGLFQRWTTVCLLQGFQGLLSFINMVLYTVPFSHPGQGQGQMFAEIGLLIV